MGTSRSDSKITSAGFAVTGELPSTESSDLVSDITGASVLALPSGEGGYGEEVSSSTERTIDLGDFALTSTGNDACGLALRLFPIGTKAAIMVARIMLPFRSTFIVSPPSHRWAPKPFSRGDIQAASFSLYSFPEP